MVDDIPKTYKTFENLENCSRALIVSPIPMNYIQLELMLMESLNMQSRDQVLALFGQLKLDDQIASYNQNLVNAIHMMYILFMTSMANNS